MTKINIDQKTVIEEYSDFLESAGIKNKSLIPLFYRHMETKDPIYNIGLKVAELLDIPVSMLFSKSRKREFVDARFICYVMSYAYVPNISRIGGKFNRDHSTVCVGIQAFTDHYEMNNKEFKEKARKCLSALNMELEYRNLMGSTTRVLTAVLKES